MPFRKSEAGAGGFHSEQSSNIWSADKTATGEGTAKRVQAHMHALSCMEKTYSRENVPSPTHVLHRQFHLLFNPV